MTDVHITDDYTGYVNCYHTDEDCGQLPKNTTTVAKSYAENKMGLRLCKHCEGYVVRSSDNKTYRNALEKEITTDSRL